MSDVCFKFTRKIFVDLLNIPAVICGFLRFNWLKCEQIILVINLEIFAHLLYIPLDVGTAKINKTSSQSNWRTNS